MLDFYETGLEISMSDTVSGGAALAWRLLATLEGGSLVLATTALLAYSARRGRGRSKQHVKTVLVTDTSSPLGNELKSQLECHGCVVRTLPCGASESGSGDKVDALVVIGAQSHTTGLDGLADLVTKDVYENMKLLDSLSSTALRRGGYIAWAAAGAVSGSRDAFSSAAEAFDAALQASLTHVAKSSHCEPVWVGRRETAEEAASLVVAALLTCTTQQNTKFSIRNAASKVSCYIGRWLKIIT